MKRLITVVLALTVIAMSVPSYADTVSKFRGGFRDVMMSPMRVSDSVKAETANAKFLPFALVGGLLKGSFYMAKQIIGGTLDVVTSPLETIHYTCPLDK